MNSRRLSRIRRYSGAQIRDCVHFAYGTVTLCGSTFLKILLCSNFVTLWEYQHTPYLVPRPLTGNATGL